MLSLRSLSQHSAHFPIPIGIYGYHFCPNTKEWRRCDGNVPLAFRYSSWISASSPLSLLSLSLAFPSYRLFHTNANRVKNHTVNGKSSPSPSSSLHPSHSPFPFPSPPPPVSPSPSPSISPSHSPSPSVTPSAPSSSPSPPPFAFPPFFPSPYPSYYSYHWIARHYLTSLPFISTIRNSVSFLVFFDFQWRFSHFRFLWWNKSQTNPWESPVPFSAFWKGNEPLPPSFPLLLDLCGAQCFDSFHNVILSRRPGKVMDLNDKKIRENFENIQKLMENHQQNIRENPNSIMMTNEINYHNNNNNNNNNKNDNSDSEWVEIIEKLDGSLVSPLNFSHQHQQLRMAEGNHNPNNGALFALPFASAVHSPSSSSPSSSSLSSSLSSSSPPPPSSSSLSSLLSAFLTQSQRGNLGIQLVKNNDSDSVNIQSTNTKSNTSLDSSYSHSNFHSHSPPFPFPSSSSSSSSLSSWDRDLFHLLWGPSITVSPPYTPSPLAPPTHYPFYAPKYFSFKKSNALLQSKYQKMIQTSLMEWREMERKIDNFCKNQGISPFKMLHFDPKIHNLKEILHHSISSHPDIKQLSPSNLCHFPIDYLIFCPQFSSYLEVQNLPFSFSFRHSLSSHFRIMSFVLHEKLFHQRQYEEFITYCFGNGLSPSFEWIEKGRIGNVDGNGNGVGVGKGEGDGKGEELGEGKREGSEGHYYKNNSRLVLIAIRKTHEGTYVTHQSVEEMGKHFNIPTAKLIKSMQFPKGQTLSYKDITPYLDSLPAHDEGLILRFHRLGLSFRLHLPFFSIIHNLCEVLFDNPTSTSHIQYTMGMKDHFERAVCAPTVAKQRGIVGFERGNTFWYLVIQQSIRKIFTLKSFIHLGAAELLSFMEKMGVREGDQKIIKEIAAFIEGNIHGSVQMILWGMKYLAYKTKKKKNANTINIKENVGNRNQKSKNNPKSPSIPPPLSECLSDLISKHSKSELFTFWSEINTEIQKDTIDTQFHLPFPLAKLSDDSQKKSFSSLILPIGILKELRDLKETLAVSSSSNAPSRSAVLNPTPSRFHHPSPSPSRSPSSAPPPFPLSSPSDYIPYSETVGKQFSQINDLAFISLHYSHKHGDFPMECRCPRCISLHLDMRFAVKFIFLSFSTKQKMRKLFDKFHFWDCSKSAEMENQLNKVAGNICQKIKGKEHTETQKGRRGETKEASELEGNIHF